jgi:hypothetical protein
MRYWFGNTAHPQTDYGSDFCRLERFLADMMAATVIDPKGLEERTLKTLEGIRLDVQTQNEFFARTKEFGSDEVHVYGASSLLDTAQQFMILANFWRSEIFVQRRNRLFKDAIRTEAKQKIRIGRKVIWSRRKL